MTSLSFKTKILLLVIVPLILVSVALTSLSIYQAEKLGGRNIESFSNMIFDLRRGELKNYTELALSAVKHIYDYSGLNDTEAQEAAKEIFRNLEFGEDGYFFVYDYTGKNLAHPKKPGLEGKNLWSLQDSNGVYLIRSLVEQARIKEGGYTDYIWDKPSKKREVAKIGYSMGLENWDWMVGTGLYVDDLEDAVAVIESEVSDNIQNTLKLIAGLALTFTVFVGLIGARFTMSEGKLADEKLKQLSHKAVKGQEEERSRVALNLQKEINHALKVARTKLEKVHEVQPIEDVAAKNEFDSAVGILDKTIDAVYRISGELRPELLDKMGLHAALEELAKKVTREKNIHVTYKRVGEDKKLPADVETGLYRIIQAALDNIVTYSKSPTANIKAHQTHNTLSISIQDVGVGFDAKKVLDQGRVSGLGLVDMRVRAESLGGKFAVFSSHNTGTIIKVDIPV